MKNLAALQSLFQKEIDTLNLGEAPAKLYDPMHYIMQLGGKRLRPILSLMGAQIYGDPAKAMPQAMAGTFASLQQAGQFVEVIEERQGLKVGCIEEIAYEQGFIDADQLKQIAEPLVKSGYGKYLLKLLK